MPTDVFGDNVQTDPLQPYYARYLFKTREHVCKHCLALHWLEEKSTLSTKKKHYFQLLLRQWKSQITLI